MVRKFKGLLCIVVGFMFGLKIDFGQFMYNRLGVSYMLIGGAITLACFYAGVHFLFPYPKFVGYDEEDDDDNDD